MVAFSLRGENGLVGFDPGERITAGGLEAEKLRSEIVQALSAAGVAITVD
jgi:hypothetical protein